MLCCYIPHSGEFVLLVAHAANIALLVVQSTNMLRQVTLRNKQLRKVVQNCTSSAPKFFLQNVCHTGTPEGCGRVHLEDPTDAQSLARW